MADLFERGPEVDALLARALDRPTEARRAYVERACGADVRLRDAVLKLLAASEAEEVAPLLRPGGALQGPVFDDLVNGLDSDGPTIAPGTLLGPYEIVSLLGEGGMGQVFRATDLRLRRDVALKVIDERTRSASHVERFAREARAASALNHPNIVTIYDVGREGAMFYIAMELIEGRTLRGYISGGCLDATLLLPLATQLANGLHAAHERGVVHRDLKPSNIIVTENGTAKILDFGLAKREAPRADSSADTASLEENLTGEGLIFGTVGYMSPEQASGKRVDFRSDLFSFGAILYEMATGTAPFKRGSAAETLAAILTEEPAPVDWKGSGLPTQLRIVLERCLAKDPARRFESTGAMLSELTRGDVDARPLTCDSCGGHSSASSQYCSQCGAQLASRQEGDGVARPEAPAPDLSEAGERRHATLLVARPCGYESLIERLPSDDVDELMGRFETIAATVIGRHGGVLNRFAHEEAVGLFGVPTAHEDDAGRAVRAALDLRRRVAGLAREDPRLADLACSVSAAVHTGMIVAQASRQSGERYRIAGDVVGVARSLCDAAGPGEVLMSSESRRLCSASVQAEAKLPVRLRGGSEPTTPHRVVAADDRSPVPLESVEGALTPFAGRAAQLAELDRHLNAADRGHGRFVAVVGDAGSGKSRLLYELRRRVERSDTTALEVRCQAYGRSIAYLPLIQACRDVLDLVEGANAEVQAARAVERILELDAGLERLLPVYLHLLALPSESHPLPSHLVRADLRYAMQEALVALFTATARRRPTLMIVEDCHWIDDASREAILQLAEMCGDASLLVVVSSRTELGAEWSQHAAPITIRLAPLDAASSNEMIRGVLEAHDVPEQLGALIRERSGGNPFFLEELCRKLTSEGYVEARGGVAELTRDIGVLELPDTVQAVIRSRLDRADAGPRELLRQASVIGREFSLAVLERVVGREVRLRSSLATLKQLGLIRQVGVLPHPVYRFQHALTQEVAYDSLLQHQRKALHGRVGRALEAEFGERLDEHCERLAQHFAAAESWEKAVEYGRCSASRASALAQFQEALAALERARAWIARLPDRGGRAEQTVQVLFEEEKACELLGERAKQREAIDQLLALLGDEPRTELVDAHIRNADLLALERRFDEGEVVIQKALTLTRRLGDRSRERDVLHSLVFLRWQGGRNEEALGTLAELLDIDRALGEPGPLVLHLLNRATVLKGLGRYADALPDVREAHSFLDDLDDPNRVNEANYVAYLVYRGLGDEALAESYLRRAAQSIDAASDAVILPHSMATMATMLIERGETEEGIAMLERTVEISRASRYAFGLSQLEQSLGDALLGLGRKQEALPHFRIAAATFRRMRDVGGELRACAGAARIIEADAPVEARTMWERALELARELGESCAAVEAHRGLARLDQAADEPAGAIRHLECALEVSEPESRERADLLNQLGILEWTGGDFESALRRYEEAQSIFAVLGDAVHEGLMLNSMAATLRSMGRQDEAIETLERALEAHVASGQALLEGHALALLGDLHLDREEAPAAIECYAESLELRRKLGDRLGEGWMRHHLGRAELGAARPERAREHVAAAQGIAAECDSSELTAACRDLGLE